MLTTVADRHFRSGSWPEENHCQIADLTCQYTRTVNSGTIQWKSPNTSELGGLPAGRPAGPSDDSHNDLVFSVWWMWTIKARYLAANDLFLDILQFAVSIILESVFFILFFVFKPRKVVNSSVMSWSIWAIPWLPNMQDQKLLMLHWCQFSGWGNTYVMHCFEWKHSQNILNDLLAQSDTYISHNATPGIGAALWTLIFRMGQGVCCYWCHC